MGRFFSGSLVEKMYYDEKLEATSGIKKVINSTYEVITTVLHFKPLKYLPASAILLERIAA